MNFYLIPTAEASVITLMQSINRVVINPLILFMFSVAVVYFLYGVVQYLMSPDDEEVRTTSKSHMLYGIIGIFIMISVFGIMRLVLSTVGENKIKVTDNGDISISKDGYSNIGFPDVPVTTDPNDPLGPGGTPPGGTPGNAFTKSPFKGNYVTDATCWRIYTYSTGNDSAAVMSAAEPYAKQSYANYFNIPLTSVPAGIPHMTTEAGVDPLLTDSKDPAHLVFYHWFIAYAPKPGLSLNCSVSPMSDFTPPANGTFANNNPFSVTTDYMSTVTHINETAFVSGPTGTSSNNFLPQQARDAAIRLIESDLGSSAIYEPSKAIIKNKTLTDTANNRTYFWALISYPRPVASFVNANPFTAADYAGTTSVPTTTATHVNDTAFTMGTTGAVSPSSLSLSASAVFQAQEKIKTTLGSGITYVQSNFITKSRTVTDTVGGKTYYWALVFYPKPSNLFVNTNPFTAADYAGTTSVPTTTATHINDTAFVDGPNGSTTLPTAAINLAITKIQNAISSISTYNSSKVITKSKTVPDTINNKTYYWALAFYPKPLQVVLASNLNVSNYPDLVRITTFNDYNTNSTSPSRYNFIASGMSAQGEYYAEENAKYNAKVILANKKGFTSIAGLSTNFYEEFRYSVSSGSNTVYHYWMAVYAPR